MVNNRKSMLGDHFKVKQGWKPLCDFLDLPVPDSEFPRVNDTQAMQQAGR